eukprot:2531472-Alexandrium_andersonii.AAC.1
MSASLVGSEMCIRDSSRTSSATAPCSTQQFDSCLLALRVQLPRTHFIASSFSGSGCRFCCLQHSRLADDQPGCRR